MAQLKRKKKVDYAALNSPFMRIPQMKIDAARSLLDAGMTAIYELEGRSPDALFDELKRKKPETPDDHRPFFRLAVYYAEHNDPEPGKLSPNAWKD